MYYYVWDNLEVAEMGDDDLGLFWHSDFRSANFDHCEILDFRHDKILSKLFWYQSTFETLKHFFQYTKSFGTHKTTVLEYYSWRLERHLSKVVPGFGGMCNLLRLAERASF